MPAASARVTKSRSTLACSPRPGMAFFMLCPPLGQPNSPITIGLPGKAACSLLYQPSQRVTDDRPIAVSDGHDFPGLIDDGVPGVAAVIDDVVERFEDAVRQPVLAHALPDIFLAVKLGRARRQRQERD